jgi:hypothetical protein
MGRPSQLPPTLPAQAHAAPRPAGNRFTNPSSCSSSRTGVQRRVVRRPRYSGGSAGARHGAGHHVGVFSFSFSFFFLIGLIQPCTTFFPLGEFRHCVLWGSCWADVKGEGGTVSNYTILIFWLVCLRRSALWVASFCLCLSLRIVCTLCALWVVSSVLRASSCAACGLVPYC